MSRFVRPETVTLRLLDGDAITVRRWLTEGERRDAYSQMYREGIRGLVLDPTQMRLALVVAYLIDWTLVDDEGRQVIIRDQPLEIVRAAVSQLFPGDFEEIHAAIDAHESRELAARTQEKKRGRERGSDSAPTLQSVG